MVESIGCDWSTTISYLCLQHWLCLVGKVGCDWLTILVVCLTTCWLCLVETIGYVLCLVDKIGCVWLTCLVGFCHVGLTGKGSTRGHWIFGHGSRTGWILHSMLPKVCSVRWSYMVLFDLVESNKPVTPIQQHPTAPNIQQHPTTVKCTTNNQSHHRFVLHMCEWHEATKLKPNGSMKQCWD